MFKKVLAMLTSFAIILPIGVNAKAVYNLADTKNIASGVVLTNVLIVQGGRILILSKRI